MKVWLRWLLVGIASVVFGIFILGNTVAASIAVTTLVGALFAVTGVVQVIVGFGEESTGSKILSILLGTMMFFIGISFLFNPLEGVISLALLVTILIAIGGVLRLSFSFRMRQTEFFWPMLLSGALSILLAGYILANFETASVNLLGILLGIELVLNGAGLIVLAVFLRKAAKAIRKA